MATTTTAASNCSQGGDGDGDDRDRAGGRVRETARKGGQGQQGRDRWAQDGRAVPPPLPSPAICVGRVLFFDFDIVAPHAFSTGDLVFLCI